MSNESQNTIEMAGITDRQKSRMVMSRSEYIIGLGWRMAVILIAVGFALFPILFVASSAFNPQGDLSTTTLIPKSVDSLDDLTKNFRDLMFNKDELEIFPFWNWLINSFIVATVSTVLIVAITALSAYSFSRFRFKGRRSMLLGILLIQVFPNLLAMVALFLILLEIGRLVTAIPEAIPALSFIDWGFIDLFSLNSLGGLILVYMGGAMGINTWLMKGFFDSIPRDIDESAMVDGATHWQTFWYLIFPLVRPILAVVGVLAFIGTFNEFVLARVILRDKEHWTLMVGLYEFVNADFTRSWGKFAAGALVSGTPIVVIYLALQDQIVGGLTQGSVKG
jgi:arabinogalactan oligomer / maltooligosaccharide transport system permease protein